MVSKKKRQYLWEEIQNYEDFDIIVINESWYCDNTDIDMYLEGYSLQTNADRSGRIGGGTAIYVKIGLKVHSQKSMSLGTWIQWSQITIKDTILATFYRSQQATPADNRKLIKQLRTLKGRKAIVTADANLPNIMWGKFDSAATNAKYSMERDFTLLCHEMGLTQHVTQPTRYHKQSGTANLLDIILSTDKDSILGEVTVMDEDFFSIRDPAVGGSDHRGISFKVSVEIPKPKDQVVTMYDYHKTNWAHYARLVGQAKVNNLPLRQRVRESRDLNECVQVVNHAMTSAFKACVKKKKVVISGSPPWSKPELTARFKEAKALRKRYKRDPRKYWLRDKWLKLAKRNRAESRKLRILHEGKKVAAMEEDSKNLYRYVKQLKGQRDTIGPLENKEGEVVYSDLEMAEALADHYKTVNNPYTPADVDWSTAPGSDDLVEVNCDPSLIVAIIEDFKDSKSTDVDGLSVFLLKKAKEQLSDIISIIAHRSINEQGIFPFSQKLGCISPLYKGKRSSRSLCANYRPITINGTIGKVIESCVYKALRDYLEQNKLLDDEQFGFRRNRSTVQHLVLTWKDIIKAMRKGSGNTLLSIDLKAAFDKILHHLLLRKLRTDGISGPLGRWFENWVTERRYVVKVGETCSTPRDVTSGIGQGTTLGPLLFIYSVSGCFRKLKLLCRSFADDTSGCYSVQTEVDAKDMQRDIDAIVEWADANGMVISVPKCRIQRFGNQLATDFFIKGERIPVGTSEELLGVTLSTSCRFTDHVNKTLGKCYNLLNMIEKHFVTKDFKVYRQLYCTYISGVMSYASQVWFERDTHVMKMFMVFWRKYWAMTGYEPPADLMDPIQMFLLNDLLFLKKWVDGKIPINLADHFTQAGARGPRIHRSFTSGKLEEVASDPGYKNEFCSRVIPYYNTSFLDNLRTEENYNKFKRNVKKLIFEKKISYEHIPGSNVAVART